MTDQHEISHESKYHVQNENKEETANTTEAKTMTNICSELLERIFDFLDLESLLCLAGTNKRLHDAAATKFGDKFGNKYIWLFKSDFLETMRAPGVYLNGDQIDVIGLKFCFQFLRCFGAKISNLEDPFSYIRNDHFDRYVNQYCADTLTNITSYREGTFPIDNCSKPFKHVEKVQISDANLGNQLTNFMNLFPNLRHLEMTDIKIDETAIDVSVPQLNHLALKVRSVHGNCKNEFTTRNALNFLRANRQLQSLDIYSNDRIRTFSELLNIISENPLLLKLKILLEEFTVVNAVEVERFVNEHPLVEELYLPFYKFTADDAVKLISQLNSLKRFEFQFIFRYERDHFLNQLDKKWQHSVSSCDIIITSNH